MTSPTPDLVFSRPALVGAAHLVFGDEGAGGEAPAIPPVTLYATGKLSGLRGHVTLRTAAVLRASGRLSGLRGHVTMAYDINVERTTVGEARTHWQNAAPASAATSSAWQQSQQRVTGAAVRYQAAQPVQRATRTHWQSGLARQIETRARYQQARQQQVDTAAHWQSAWARQIETGSRYQDARQLGTAPLRAHWQESLRDRGGAVQAHWQDADRLVAAVQQSNRVALQLARATRSHWQEAWVPRPGRSATTPVVPGAEPCYLPDPHLVFEALWTADARLVFICERHGGGPNPEPGATVVVPILRTYVTINQISLRRVEGDVPIAAYGFSMSLDADSWTWSWSATLHSSALPLIQPGSNGDPVEVEALVNGVPYRLCAESVSRQREFAQTRISVRGRGTAAILDAPYAPVLNHGNAQARTAQQLMADVLTVNGVGIGWTVDFGLSDWLVPGDVWTHQGAYISAVLDIAQAAGGYVQPHDTAQTLRILPRYPDVPWNWSTLTPDFELPAAVVDVEGIDWQRKAAYDRVFVGSAGQGVLWQVTRTGTAGGNVVPMVTDPLITHATAARQRGLAILSDTGRQAHISLSLPVLAQTGVIKPGALVRYVDAGQSRVGLVRSTSLAWSRPTLRQTLSLETHL